MKRVLRYQIDLDDRPSEIGVGKVLLATPYFPGPEMNSRGVVSAGGPPKLDVWVEVSLPAHWPQFQERKRRVKVVSTEQPISESLEHLVSCSVGLEIVHVYEWL